MSVYLASLWVFPSDELVGFDASETAVDHFFYKIWVVGNRQQHFYFFSVIYLLITSTMLLVISLYSKYTNTFVLLMVNSRHRFYMLLLVAIILSWHWRAECISGLLCSSKCYFSTQVSENLLSVFRNISSWCTALREESVLRFSVNYQATFH